MLVLLILFGCFLIGSLALCGLYRSCSSPNNRVVAVLKEPNLGPYRTGATKSVDGLTIVLPQATVSALIQDKRPLIDFAVKNLSEVVALDVFNCPKCANLAIITKKINEDMLGKYCQCNAFQNGHLHPKCLRCHCVFTMRTKDDPDSDKSSTTPR
jgi:hypothetical protein